MPTIAHPWLCNPEFIKIQLEKNTVRSVQRIANPSKRTAKFVARIYPIWLTKTFASLVNANFDGKFVKFSFLKIFGNSKNFVKWMLLWFFIINLYISSVVKDRIGANHFNNELRIIFNKIIVDFLFLESLESQYKESFLISK